MPPGRIEKSSSCRAGCQATRCSGCRWARLRQDDSFIGGWAYDLDQRRRWGISRCGGTGRSLVAAIKYFK